MIETSSAAGIMQYNLTWNEKNNLDQLHVIWYVNVW